MVTSDFYSKNDLHIQCKNKAVFMHEFFYDALIELIVKISHDRSHIDMVFLLYVFLYDKLNLTNVEISFYNINTDRVSLLNEFFYGL